MRSIVILLICSVFLNAGIIDNIKDRSKKKGDYLTTKLEVDKEIQITDKTNKKELEMLKLQLKLKEKELKLKEQELRLKRLELQNAKLRDIKEDKFRNKKLHVDFVSNSLAYFSEERKKEEKERALKHAYNEICTSLIWDMKVKDYNSKYREACSSYESFKVLFPSLNNPKEDK